MIKLYKILFEQQEQLKLLSPEQMKAPESAFSHLKTPKVSKSYAAPTFAVHKWKSGSEHGFALFHVDMLRKWIESQKSFPYEKWLCAYASTYNEHRGDCSDAVEVNYIARSPEFPGAGSVMYALVSDYFGAPITSDRQSSTSNSAKKAWANIESSSDWTKVDLDNFKDGPTWYRIDGNWPNRKVKAADEPATPDDSDDCNLPVAADEEGINKKLGTADAWLYKGNIDSSSLIDRGYSAISEIADETGGYITDIEKDIESLSNSLFVKYYKGISG